MINLFQVSALFAFIVNIVIGFTVYFMNPRRRTNRCFLLAALVLACWLAGLAVGSWTENRSLIIFCIRYATVSSCFLLPAFDLLRLSIMTDAEKKLPIRSLLFWIALLIPELIFLHLPQFILDIRISASGFPQPIYGWPQVFFMLCYLYGLVVLIRRFAIDFRRSKGIQRAEMGFTVLASALAAVLGVLTGQLAPLLTGNPDIAQLLPLIGILLNVVIAYGIATRRIMNVSDVLRRATSYALLVGYMIILYLAVLFAAQWVFTSILSHPATTVAHMVAAIVVAFSLAPAHGRSQEFASRLFVNVEKMDVSKTVKKVQDALSQIGPLDDLTQRFGDIIQSAAGTDHLVLLISRNGSYDQVYPALSDAPPCQLAATDALVDVVKSRGGPVTVETMTRMRPTPQNECAIDSLKKLDSNLAVGVYSKDHLDALMLVGKRLSGKLFGPEEQDALQIVCNQFGVAFENAKLYTELQDRKIYNDILVDSLVSGIIAVHSDGKVSVFNREAQRITGIEAEDVIGAPMDALPASLVASFKETLVSRSEIMDRELTIQRGDDLKVPIRLSCSVFHSHKGSLLGVLGIFSDLTLLKKLEDQVRRSDRLSSIGTLAAGMAHEIKNPLVSISTFTQLLPERYEEEDFRNTFSRLIGKEVQRIDSIVSRLLKFSRPAKPFLQSIRLHDALDDSINLISQQLRRKDIKLVKHFDAANSVINGDIDLLNQAFINFFLNAVEAMDEGGTLTVSTVEIKSRWYTSRTNQSGARIRLSIMDTGCGIPAKDISKIFDPFFTSKSSGTGLGLSVSHSIIDEHDATIEVETAEGKGTTFHILFPLLTEKEHIS